MAEKELLVDVLRIDGKEYHKGDLVDVKDDEREKRLVEAGALGDKGSLERQQKFEAAQDEWEAKQQLEARGMGANPKHGATGSEDDRGQPKLEESKDEEQPARRRRGAAQQESDDKSDEKK